MTTKHKSLLKIFFCSLYAFLLLPFALNAADSSTSAAKWVIGAEKFRYSSAYKEDDAVVEGISQMFPNRIMEKIDEDWTHVEYPEFFSSDNPFCGTC